MKSLGGKVFSSFLVTMFWFRLRERCIHVCRQREARKVQGESRRRIRLPREQAHPRAMAAPEANAENQSNIDVRNETVLFYFSVRV